MEIGPASSDPKPLGTAPLGMGPQNADTDRARISHTVQPCWYWLVGVAFGLLFPLVGTIVEAQIRDLGLSLSAFASAQAGQPILWIVDSAPLVLGLFAAAVGRRQARVEELSDLLATKRLSETLEQFFERSPDPIAALDLDGRILRINGGFTEVLGYEAEEAVGRVADSFVAPDDRETVGARHALLREGRTPHNAELRVFTKTGKVRHLQWSSFPLPEAGVSYSVARDVTAERELREALRAAKEAAEEASRMKSEFLANMSHELRTPMHGVLGMLELLGDTTLSDDQRDFVKSADEAAHRLFALLEDLLDFSKIESGSIELDRESFRLLDALRGPLKTLAGRAAEKGLALTYEHARGLPVKVIGDRSRVSQVVTTLVGNAIKFTESGEVVVSTQWEPSTDVEANVTITVRDTGIGFDEGARARIFDAFSQGDGSYTRAHGGTGLGLAVAARLASLMGGSLDAESEVDVGSVFTLQLALGRDVCARDMDPAPRFDGRRAMVVCGHEKSRAVLCEYLERRGVRTTTASAVDEMLAVARASRRSNDPVDIAFVDVAGAGTETLAPVRFLAEDSRYGPIGVVLLASAGGLPDLRNYGRLDELRTLRTPVFPDELQTELEAAFGSLRLSVAREGRESPSAIAGRTAMVVEDNRVNQTLASMFLQRRGFKVTVANDGLEALEHFRRQGFDLILMDVQMPNMDGLDATRAIREVERDRLRRVPIIALTAHDLKRDRERCLDAGMDEYVTKPIEASVLGAAIERQLGEPRVDFRLARALENALGDHALLDSLLALHGRETPQHLSAIGCALGRRDGPASTEAAEAIERTAKSLAMPKLQEMAHELAVLSRRGEFEEAAARVAPLEEAYRASEKAVRDATGAA